MTKLFLYQLIKEQSIKKGRSLKIICDWDECIQPINPLIWYNLAKEKGWKLDKEPFEEWFSHYWTNAQVEYQESCPLTKHTTIKEVEEIRELLKSILYILFCRFCHDSLDWDSEKR